MAVYNRIGGGINKITLNGKPPIERMNLIEAESIIKNRVAGIGNFQILSRKNNQYYISSSRDSVILKGNPYEGWTQIFSLKDNSILGNIRVVKNNADDSLTFLTSYGANNTSIYFYEIKNGLLTLKKGLTVRGDVINIFILKNTVYFHTVYNYTNYLYKNEMDSESLTDITNNLIFEDGTQIMAIGSSNNGTTYNDKRYQAKYISKFKNLQIIEFDGITVRVAKEIETEFEIYEVYPEQYTGCNSDEIYFSILSDDISSDSAIKRKYKLINKELNIVKEGETIYPVLSSFFVIKDIYIARETQDSKNYVMVEFPVQAYVKRE